MASSPFYVYIPHTLLNASHGSLYGYKNLDQAYVTKLRQCGACSHASNLEVFLGTWTNEEEVNGIASSKRGLVTLHGPVGHYPNVTYNSDPSRAVIVVICNMEKITEANYEGRSEFVHSMAGTLKEIVKQRPMGGEHCHDELIPVWREKDVFSDLSRWVLLFFCIVCDFFEGLLSKFHAKIRQILSISYTLTHLAMTFRQAKSCFHSNVESRKNFILRAILNIVFGLLVIYVIASNSLSYLVAEAAIKQARFAAEQISDLLDWILDVPAGLKLNKQLTEILGYFFGYHIYLWKGYLFFLEPYLSSIIFWGSLTGILGFTFQISFALDLIAMMSLHVHCFYVYAARLYSLQLYALLILWNLFRGKRWNPQREREDTVPYDTTQLFVGTLIFACLFFLFPTTLVYYLCFTGLRLFVITIQGVLYRTSLLLNRIPLYKVYQVMTCANEICVNLSFRPLPKTQGQPLFLSMDLTPLGIGDLKLDEVEFSGEKVPWSMFVKKLVGGDLVYPWIRIVTRPQYSWTIPRIFERNE